MGKSDKAEKTAGGIPQGQMSASLPTWPGSPPSPYPSSGLPVTCSTPAVSLKVAILKELAQCNCYEVRFVMLCSLKEVLLLLCKESLPFPCTAGPSRTALSADRLTSPTFAQPKLAPSTSLQTV